MARKALITLRVVIDIPKDAEVVDGFIHLPSGEALLPLVAFEDEQNMFADSKSKRVSHGRSERIIIDDEAIADIVGEIGYEECTIQELATETNPED